MSDRIALEFAELATLARETILEVRLVGWTEPATVDAGWTFIGGNVPFFMFAVDGTRYCAARSEVMELAAVGWEWTPCGPGCACNEQTLVCWGPIGAES